MANEEGFHQATTTLQMLQYQIEEMRNIKMLRNVNQNIVTKY